MAKFLNTLFILAYFSVALLAMLPEVKKDIQYSEEDFFRKSEEDQEDFRKGLPWGKGKGGGMEGRGKGGMEKYKFKHRGFPRRKGGGHGMPWHKGLCKAKCIPPHLKPKPRQNKFPKHHHKRGGRGTKHEPYEGVYPWPVVGPSDPTPDDGGEDPGDEFNPRPDEGGHQRPDEVIKPGPGRDKGLKNGKSPAPEPGGIKPGSVKHAKPRPKKGGHHRPEETIKSGSGPEGRTSPEYKEEVNPGSRTGITSAGPGPEEGTNPRFKENPGPKVGIKTAGSGPEEGNEPWLEGTAPAP